MQDDKLKMVIVMRTDLNMRKGKMVAQGSHAACAVLAERIKLLEAGDAPEDPYLKGWLAESFTKICVGVESEEELLDVLDKASKHGLNTKLITDNGLTEFRGEPTRTCASIGPAPSSEIDKITGGLKLL